MADSEVFDDCCPCCTGADFDDIDDLCEDCLLAFLEDGCARHAAKVPLDDIDILRSLPTQQVTIVVEPVRHELGRVWYWLRTIETVRAECPGCRPTLPCWKHQQVVTDLRHSGYGPLVEEPKRCQSARHDDPLTSSVYGEVRAEKHGGGTWTLCAECTVESLGPIAADAEVAR